MWLAFQAGLTSWVFNVALDRGREELLVSAGNVAGEVLGAGGAETLAQGGMPMLAVGAAVLAGSALRSEEHTSELQSLMRISYAVFCLKKKKQPNRVQYY